MYYDEYEISIGKEINVCRRSIKRLKTDLLKLERQYGMTTEQFLSSPEGGPGPVGNRDMDRWRDDHRQQREWEQRLRAYEEALAMLKRDPRVSPS
jgi:hypothetical protein